MACLELVKRWVCDSLPAEVKGTRSPENLGERSSMAGVVCARVWEAGTRGQYHTGNMGRQGPIRMEPVLENISRQVAFSYILLF